MRVLGIETSCDETGVAIYDAERGLLAVVRDGDPIRIDIPSRALKLELPEAEIARRMAELPPWEPAVKTGYLRRYAQVVTSASTGAVFRE